jgi:signal peptidase I
MPDKVENMIHSDNQSDEVEEKPVLLEKREIGEFAKTALIAVFIALVIRSVLFEPFNIPSGSMKPTLLVGDYLFVNKPAYGYSRYSFPFAIAPIEGRIFAKEPQRGDVVVFALPSNDSIDYIKRVIGLPGDDIQVMRGRLFINDEIVPRELIETKEITKDGGEKQIVNLYLETLPDNVEHYIYEETDNERLDDTPLYTVPEGHYFVMGDNRDNSQDSRVIDHVGPVPYENIIGRADFLFFSTNGHARLFELWKWPWSIRYERLFMDIDPKRPEE